MEHFVITIARGFGSGGKEIASKLAQMLKIPATRIVSSPWLLK